MYVSTPLKQTDNNNNNNKKQTAKFNVNLLKVL